MIGRRFWLAIGIAVFGQTALTVVWAAETPNDLEHFGFRSDKAGVRACLRQFMPSSEDVDRTEALIGQLDDDDYYVRQRATAELAKMPGLSRGRLVRALEHPSLEVRCRVKRLLLLRPEEADQQALKAALGVIVRKEITGLAPDVLAAISRAPADPLWQVAQQALQITVKAGDEPLLRTSLAGESALVRVAAARGLIRLLDQRADDALVPLLDDADDRIRLLAAMTLGNHGHRGCLPALAGLLGSEGILIRYRSVYALRWLTGKRFDYGPGAEPGQREEATARWTRWVRTEGQTAQLRFPIELPKEMVLFNGVNLEGWREFANGRILSGQGAWSVNDGNLLCNGQGSNGPGTAYLRTEQAFSDYLLKLQWRFPNGTGDSGVGLMMTGPDRMSPMCLEVQLRPNNSGDLYPIGGFQANFGAGNIGFRPTKMHPSNELPPGEWNRLEIRVQDGTVEIKVNGLVQNRATNCTKAAGRINLRNEGSAVEFRQLTLLPLGE
jgi:hypothetical protein